MDTKRKLVTILIFACMNIDLLKSQESVCNADNYLKELIYFPSGNNIVFPSKKIEDRLIERGKFYPSDMVPTRFIFYEETVLITFPKFKRGVPFSLAKMDLKDEDRCEPQLHPYPSWTDHDERNCDSISNAIDLFMSPNNIVWILDIGIENTLDKPVKKKSPKVFGIDASISKIKYLVPLNLFAVPSSRLQYIVADCSANKTILYISDAYTRSIIVYNVNIPSGFKIILPESVTERITKSSVLYLAIIFQNISESFLYFTYTESKEMFRATARSFRLGKTHGVIESVGFKPDKMVPLGTDSQHNLFFRFKQHKSIYVWNTKTKLQRCNFLIIKRSKEKRVATHVVKGYRTLIWMLETNFHDYLACNLGCLGPSSRILPIIRNCVNCIRNCT